MKNHFFYLIVGYYLFCVCRTVKMLCNKKKAALFKFSKPNLLGLKVFFFENMIIQNFEYR